jgi:DNA polymerase III subunit epsilon
MLPTKLAFVDVETTGLRSNFDRIIEIGVLRVEDGQLVKTFKTLLNPGCSLPPEITYLTGITSAELENAPSFREIRDDLEEVLADCVMVAHNVRFDYSFLRNEFKRLGVNFSPKQICTVKLSRQLYPQYPRHNLDSLIERLGIECATRHRAFEDAGVLWEFYQIILQSFKKEQLLQALNKVWKRPSLPVNLSIDLNTLPDGPGVYIFYGQSEVPLYVGKSVNIKTRVLSHFSSDHSSGKEMKIAQQIESIETISTCGELGALLKENYLIKKLQPLYNRMQRYTQKLVAIKRFNSVNNYEQVSLEVLEDINIADLETILGVFKSQKAAKAFLINLAKEYELCEKLLGIEKTKEACFGYRLGRCKGACVNQEAAVKYNFRFINAFSKKQIKSWPFNGPILIKEDDILNEKQEGFLVDKWCLISENREYQFDLDTYKILDRYLRSEKNIKKIQVLKSQERESQTAGVF